MNHLGSNLDKFFGAFYSTLLALLISAKQPVLLRGLGG